MDSRSGAKAAKAAGVFSICGIQVKLGETREIYLKVSESFISRPLQIPVTVVRGREPGPTAYVIAAIHGDEINGADIVRRLIYDIDHEQLKGTLVGIPVANIPGFLHQSRYLPYHRDLNRFFPGRKEGNNAERMAYRLFHEIVRKCDFGIDLHTAAHGRLNLPHVRGDMTNPTVRKLALAFGTPVLVNQAGVRGSLRREATVAGVPTLLFEAGETARFSRQVSVAGLHGVLSVLQAMGMWAAGPHRKTGQSPKRAPYKVIVQSSDWLRAQKGGILDLHVRPGELVYEGDAVATILNPFGKTVTRMRSPKTGIVIGVTTAPLAIPGTGVIHLARLKKALARVERSIPRRKSRRRQK